MEQLRNKTARWHICSALVMCSAKCKLRFVTRPMRDASCVAAPAKYICKNLLTLSLEKNDETHVLYSCERAPAQGLAMLPIPVISLVLPAVGGQAWLLW